jgi:hypothetical protein
VTIKSDKVLGEWWGQQVLDIKDLHEKYLEFDVTIQHIKLRELSSKVKLTFKRFTPHLKMDCFLEIVIDEQEDHKFVTS